MKGVFLGMKILGKSILNFIVIFYSTVSFAHHNFDKLYDKLELNGKISKDVFERSMTRHFDSGNYKKSNVVTIVDFGQNSNKSRMVVLDINKEKVLFNPMVTHGKKTGNDVSKNFSNKINSHKSSLGEYTTAETYYGKHGYSLKLDGEDSSNSNARDRYIVVHGAKYATQKWVDIYGRLGRSLGCFALDPALNRKIIDTIKNGTKIYAYK